MSRISSIADVLEMDDGFPIGAFTAKVTQQYGRKSGDGDNGPWSFENIVVKDKAGETIKIVFKNRDPIGKVVGKEIKAVCYAGTKGPSGVYAADNEFKGKISREIKITPTAEVTFVGALMHGRPEGDADDGDNGEGDGEEDYQPKKRSAKPQTRQCEDPDEAPQEDDRPRKQPQSPPKGSAQVNTLAKCRKFMAQRRIAWVIAHDAVVVAVGEANERHPEAPMNPSTITAMTLAIYNSGCFVDGLYDGLPVEKLPPPRAAKVVEASDND